jgi:hypothetical protein
MWTAVNEKSAKWAVSASVPFNFARQSSLFLDLPNTRNAPGEASPGHFRGCPHFLEWCSGCPRLKRRRTLPRWNPHEWGLPLENRKSAEPKKANVLNRVGRFSKFLARSTFIRNEPILPET